MGQRLNQRMERSDERADRLEQRFDRLEQRFDAVEQRFVAEMAALRGEVHADIAALLGWGRAGD